MTPIPAPADILAARTRAGLSQAEAAALVHRTERKRWSEWERGERSMQEAVWELFLMKTNQHPNFTVAVAPATAQSQPGASNKESTMATSTVKKPAAAEAPRTPEALLAACLELLLVTPKVNNDIYMRQDRVSFGNQAKKLCVELRAQLAAKE